ncbi:hypothetical protein OX90_00680 [Pseudomonas coronafaciens pv. porri]|uniref:Uncharacterized protein n=2 Tax=Pseudomonas TaxID=286 RepID=A0ABR5JVC8_9PSED|nr:hypothetical protein OX88_00670 [Pseudomonas coronafaciens pv. porri]KOP61506.1 hypothetical protein OX90_00680 [Pseudomonas coronafaciens pv. porri]
MGCRVAREFFTKMRSDKPCQWDLAGFNCWRLTVVAYGDAARLNGHGQSVRLNEAHTRLLVHPPGGEIDQIPRIGVMYQQVRCDFRAHVVIEGQNKTLQNDLSVECSGSENERVEEENYSILFVFA